MNRYAIIARHYLASHPDLAATVEDPETWAAAMGAEIDTTIRRVTDSMTTPDPTASYLQRRAQVTGAARIAEELALHDLLPTTSGPTSDEGWTPLVPDLRDLL